MEVAPNLTLSTPADMRLPLHWIGILYGKIRANLAATSGIYQAQDVIKMVMAGADVTMFCGALMRHGIAHIQRIEMEVVAWLERPLQFVGRTQRQHESEELPGSRRIRARSICSRPLDLYFFISNATVKASAATQASRRIQSNSVAHDASGSTRRWMCTSGRYSVSPSFVSAMI